MATVYDVEPWKLIEAVAKELEKKIKVPEWAKFVKTGAHKERPPVQENWWFIRAAAVLRTIYKDGPIGVSKLRSKYGGKRRRGVKPAKFKKASGKIIRTILQQLEEVGYLKRVEKGKGRNITPEGRSFLDKCASSILKSAEKHEPKKKELKRKIEEKGKVVKKSKKSKKFVEKK